MIRVRTRWPHRVGGITVWSPDAGYWRRIGRDHWISEGSRPHRAADDWVGPGRERRITWWRKKLARKRTDDRAAWRNI